MERPVVGARVGFGDRRYNLVGRHDDEDRLRRQEKEDEDERRPAATRKWTEEQ